jgi:hypothetical protein
MIVQTFIGETYWKDMDINGAPMAVGAIHNEPCDGGFLRMIFAKRADNNYTLIRCYPVGYRDEHVMKMAKAKIGFTDEP